MRGGKKKKLDNEINPYFNTNGEGNAPSSNVENKLTEDHSLGSEVSHWRGGALSDTSALSSLHGSRSTSTGETQVRVKHPFVFTNDNHNP